MPSLSLATFLLYFSEVVHYSLAVCVSVMGTDYLLTGYYDRKSKRNTVYAGLSCLQCIVLRNLLQLPATALTYTG